MADDESGGEQPIVIKKIVKGGGHHGGAWKVAYADFVTAMMAFFLLMWLLNATTEEQKNAISNYFDPSAPKVSDSVSGAGGVMGGTSLATEGAMVSNVQPITQPTPTGTSGSAMNSSHSTNEGSKAKQEDVEVSEDDVEAAAQRAIEQAEEEIKQEEEQKLEEIKDAIEEAVASNPALKELAENLIVEMTPEGLRIQVVDAEGRAMFPSGSARMYQKTKALMQQMAKIIEGVPNEVSIRGHTDGTPYGKGASYTNWDLSSDRANSSRRMLEEGGIPAGRINNVVGKADTEHLLPDDPTNARNRRISIVLLKEEITDPDALKKKAEARAKKKANAAKAKAMPEKGAPKLPSKNDLPKFPLERKGGASDTPSIPVPESQDFERSEGDVSFP
ncbi:MAG: flagellar motor protein MotB [Alphaproteobacteria bacterium]